MESQDFSADCSNCHALCCVALAFDQSDQFAHEKPAGMPCHLLDGMGCSIHADLADKGYKGCVSYDCLGAGQRVSSFYEQSWKTAPKQTRDMLIDFGVMRDIQELLQLLETAGKVGLPEAKEAERRQLMAQLVAARESKDSLNGFADKQGSAAVRLWLKSLADVIAR